MLSRDSLSCLVIISNFLSNQYAEHFPKGDVAKFETEHLHRTRVHFILPALCIHTLMLLCLGVMIHLYIGFPQSSASLLLLYTNLGLLV